MSETRIILADKRREEYLAGQALSRYSIYCGEEESNPIRQFAQLRLFKETTLAPGHSDELTFMQQVQLFVLPLVGKLHTSTPNYRHDVEVGEANLISVQAGESCILSNPYKNSDIHYLVAALESNPQKNDFTCFSFTKNILIELFPTLVDSEAIRVSLGLFEGRSEGIYTPKQNKNTFIWVAQGAFEVANCLLQKSDALAITSSEPIEFEALSHDAIILVIEFDAH